MNDCNIIFSILDSDTFNINELLFILFFVIIILFTIFGIQKSFFKKTIGVLSAFAMVSMYINGLIESYLKITNFKKIYNSKEYKEVFGNISDFEESKVKSGYRIDSFKVKGIEFEFTNIENSGGYNKTKNEGSVLDNNQIVKIRYLNKHTNNTKNIILYIEVCRK